MEDVSSESDDELVSTSLTVGMSLIQASGGTGSKILSGEGGTRKTPEEEEVAEAPEGRPPLCYFSSGIF